MAKKRIYISPSSQFHNKYAYGNTVEAEQCQKIANELGRILAEFGYTVRVGSNNMTISQRIAESNKFQSDIHIPIHTNAGGGDGALVLCYPSNTENKYVKAVYKALSNLLPNKDDGIRANTTLPEIVKVKGLTIYVEAEFHDNEAGAKFIVEHTTEIAEAIAIAIKNEDSDNKSENTQTVTQNKFKVYTSVNYGERDDADKAVAVLKVFGINGWVEDCTDVYKVCIGQFDNRQAVDEFAKTLRDLLFVVEQV